ncbi:non-structural maintenance of chromosomes element 3 homolog [Venturia canescens]|uniref:non-structural maintenance of chromosomes element 3 homolog n=1 Tax=Venturia canescens TaxID=32260 RepID=UPI001C9D065D|nr:non-structural maintenance of chromosomes element 3 homolog [Venturia canescens]XP_043274524.1 non-structural maintenance of chromosomes element 3 homolog [Venturia canescens]
MSQRSRRQTASQRPQRYADHEVEEVEVSQSSQHRSEKNSTRNRNSQLHRSSQMPQSSQRPSTSQASQSVRTMDESAFNLTQGTQRTKLPPLPMEEENILIGKVIKYMLLMDRDKVPIQRANIIKYALPNHVKYYKSLMPKVQSKLKEVFGYNLVELEGAKWILTNDLENVGDCLEFSTEERAEMVLLFILLAHIFMSPETECTAEDIHELLKGLEIVEDNNYFHDYFGDVKHLLNEKFVKQGYLERGEVPNSDPPIVQYKWGVRAKNELSLRCILEFISKIFNERSLESWPVQFQMMKASEA